MFAKTKLFFAAALALALAGCAEPPYNNVDNAGLEQLLQRDVPLFDVRLPEEWQETGVVAGSQRLTFLDANGRVAPGFLQNLTSSAPKDQPIALICRTGNRTDVLARHLVEQMGYTQVYNVRDGIMGWIGEGRPVDRG
jgi:rhodanese-related sulfurtransferase